MIKQSCFVFSHGSSLLGVCMRPALLSACPHFKIILREAMALILATLGGMKRHEDVIRIRRRKRRKVIEMNENDSNDPTIGS